MLHPDTIFGHNGMSNSLISLTALSLVIHLGAGWFGLQLRTNPSFFFFFFSCFCKSLWRKWIGKMHVKPRLLFLHSFFLRHIAELIFYIEELRAHVRKYGPVMQRYYVQYLSGFDAVVLNELVQVRLSALWIHFLPTALKERTQISYTSLWEQLLFVVLSWDEDQSCAVGWFRHEH